MVNTFDRLLGCEISRGGFPSERVFRVMLADEHEYLGVAPVDYFFTDAQDRLSADQPVRGAKLSGYVAARVLDAGETVLLSVPPGDVIRVSRHTKLVVPPEPVSRVPVQPRHPLGHPVAGVDS